MALPALAQIAEINAAGQGWSVMLVVRGHGRAQAGDVLIDTHSLGSDSVGAGLKLAVPESRSPKPLKPCPHTRCDGIPATDMIAFYCDSCDCR